MRRIIFTTLTLAALTTVANAEDFVTIWQKDGSKTDFLFSEKPVIKYTDTSLILTTTSSQVSLKITELSKLTVNNPSTSIESIVDRNQVRINSDEVQIIQSKKEMKVNIISEDGRVLLSGKTDADGNITINISELPTGIYILSSESVKCNFLKR